MKYVASLILYFVFASLTLALDGWETDPSIALDRAQKENKDILVVFKNKDWNPDAYGHTEWMFKLEPFKSAIDKDYVKLLLPKEDNEVLQWKEDETNHATSWDSDSSQKMFPVGGPEAILMDQHGLPYEKIGNSLANGPEWFFMKFKEYGKTKKEFLNIYNKMLLAEGEEKYKLAGEFYDNEDIFQWKYIPYDKLKQKIISEDKQDISGLKKKELEEDDLLDSLESFKSYAASIEENETLTKEQKATLISEKWSSLMKTLINKNDRQYLRYLAMLQNLPTTMDRLQASSPKEMARAMKNEIQFIIGENTESDLAKVLITFGDEMLILFDLFDQSMAGEKEGTNPVSLEHMETLLKRPQATALFKQALLGFMATCASSKNDYEATVSLLERSRNAAPWSSSAQSINDSLSFFKKHKAPLNQLFQKRKNETPLAKEDKELLDKMNNSPMNIGFGFST